MKASWNGYLTLGDIAVPVRLYMAVQSTAPKFVQVHAEDHSPVKRVYKCQDEDKEISSDALVRAVPVKRGFIEVTDLDIQKSRGDAKDIIVRQFSDPEAIPPRYYEKPYYMTPGKGGELAYALLRQAFVRANKVAIVTFFLYEKQHIGALTAVDGMLMLQQLRFADEIVSRRAVKLPSLPQPEPDQVDVAVTLMERYSTPFYIEDYRNEQNDMIHEIIDRKSKGLGPKRQTHIAPQATSEQEVVPALKALLSSEHL